MKTIILECVLNLCIIGFLGAWSKMMIDMFVDIYKTSKYSMRYKEMTEEFTITENAAYKPTILAIDYEGGPSMGDNETVLAINIKSERLNQTCRFQATKEQAIKIIQELQKLVDR